MPEPIDIESLDPLYRDVFRDPANGAPDNISKAGCLALAKLGKEAWNAWRVKFPTKVGDHMQYHNSVDFELCNFEILRTAKGYFWDDFSGFLFGDGANFKGATFGRNFQFDGSVFGCLSEFSGSKFGDRSSFKGCLFTPYVDFSDVTFGDWIDFDGAQFLGRVIFDHANFGVVTRFNGSQFGHGISFNQVTFSGGVWFEALDWDVLENVYIHRNGGINEAKRKASKENIAPNRMGKILFTDCVFGAGAYFSAREFCGETVFVRSVFKQAPDFHSCTFHQNTSFDDAVFPIAVGSDKAIRAYRTLKLAFSQQQAIREEQRFFKLEMAEEAVRAIGVQRFLYKAYALCSDYGFSIARPLALLGLSLLGFAAIYGFFSWVNHCWPNQSVCQFNSSWVEFSLIQALPLPGLDKWSDTLRGQLFPTSGWISFGVTLAVIIHKTISIAALFLAGLALRNLFKLK